MTFESVPQLFLYDVGPDLIVESLHHLFITQLGEVFDVSKFAIENEGFTFTISFNELNTDSSSPLAYLRSSCELGVVHSVIFRKFPHTFCLGCTSNRSFQRLFPISYKYVQQNFQTVPQIRANLACVSS